MADEDREQEVVEATTSEETPTSEARETAQTEDSQESGNITNEVEEAPKENTAWAAQRVELKRLKEENERMQRALDESGVDADYLRSLEEVTQGQQYQPNIQQVTPDSEVDQIYGAVNSASREAAQARLELQQLRNQMREQEDRLAEAEYPELKTDPAFQQLVAEKRLASEVVGKPRPTREIAREVKKLLSRRDEQVAEQARVETENRTLARQQATTEAKTETTGGSSSTTDEELRFRMRKGDRAASEQVIKDKLLADLDF